ncbi:predicted protein, partial [Nematostella vectensis]
CTMGGPGPHATTTVISGSRPLGMEDKRIRPGQLSANNFYNHHLSPWNSRLNSRYSWSAKASDHNQWLQIQFDQTKVTGVATQGRQDAHQWVTRYNLLHSTDGTTFTTYRYPSSDKLFQANRDRSSVVYNALNPPIYARFLRINPYGWRSYISMRAEFYGCATDQCNLPLGFQDGRITRSHMTASSLYSQYYGPWNARIQETNHGQVRGAWIAKIRNQNQWIQVDLEFDFGRPSKVVRVSTQGMQDRNYWVTQYYMTYSLDGLRFLEYKHNSNRKYFTGNRDRSTAVSHVLYPPIRARYVRIHPWGWHAYIGLRAEFFGCHTGI